MDHSHSTGLAAPLMTAEMASPRPALLPLGAAMFAGLLGAAAPAQADEEKTLSTVTVKAAGEQESKGYLAGNSVYVCTEHTPDVVDGYFQALDPVFALINECEQGRDVASLLHGPVCHAGFKRLN